jgi:hypothetical protein
MPPPSLLPDAGHDRGRRWAIAVAIIVIGAGFLLAPHSAAESFGIAMTPNPHSDAYLSVKAVRDIASGLFTAILILNRSAHLLGWFMLVATLIPLGDTVIVLRHGATASLMVITSGLLLLG